MMKTHENGNHQEPCNPGIFELYLFHAISSLQKIQVLIDTKTQKHISERETP